MFSNAGVTFLVKLKVKINKIEKLERLERFVKMEVNIFSEIVYSQFVHLLSGRLELVEKLEFGETMYA